MRFGTPSRPTSKFGTHFFEFFSILGSPWGPFFIQNGRGSSNQTTYAPFVCDGLERHDAPFVCGGPERHDAARKHICHNPETGRCVVRHVCTAREANKSADAEGQHLVIPNALTWSAIRGLASTQLRCSAMDSEGSEGSEDKDRGQTAAVKRPV